MKYIVGLEMFILDLTMLYLTKQNFDYKGLPAKIKQLISSH